MPQTLYGPHLSYIHTHEYTVLYINAHKYIEPHTVFKKKRKEVAGKGIKIHI